MLMIGLMKMSGNQNITSKKNSRALLKKKRNLI